MKEDGRMSRTARSLLQRFGICSVSAELRQRTGLSKQLHLARTRTGFSGEPVNLSYGVIGLAGR